MSDAQIARLRGSGALRAWPQLWWLVLPGLLALVVASPAIFGDFVLDDAVAVTGSACVRRALDLPLIFGRTFWCEDPAGPVQTASWRPWTVLAWWPLWRLGGGASWPFHALSVLLHAATSVLVTMLGRRLGLDARAAGVAGCLFAVLAIHAEVAASVVGASPGWGAVWSVLCLLSVASAGEEGVGWRWQALAGVSAALAMMSREDSALLLGLAWALVWALGQDQERSIGPHAGGSRDEQGAGAARLRLTAAVLVSGVVLGLLVLRAQVLGGWAASAVPAHVNPMVDLDFVARIKSGLGLVARYHFVALRGGPLAADYAAHALPVGPDLPWWQAAVGAVVLGLWGALIWAGRRHPAVLLGSVWWVGGLVLVSNLVVDTPALFAERMVYGASVGLCLAAGVGVGRLDGWTGWTGWTGDGERRTGRAVVVAFILAWGCVQGGAFALQAWRWQSARRLVEHTTDVVPQNARARAWAAELALKDGDPEAALVHARFAAKIRPRWGRAHAFEAAALDQLGQPEAALESYRRAFELDPVDAQVADLFVQFLLRYGHPARAQLIVDAHAAAVAGRMGPPVPSRASGRP